MKHIKTETETVQREKIIKTECDFCDATIKYHEDENEIKALYDFEKCGYDVDADTEIKIRLSSSYPECGNSKEIEMDICAKCFKEKVMNQAKQYREVDADW
jgi:hypothetical protein